MYGNIPKNPAHVYAYKTISIWLIGLEVFKSFPPLQRLAASHISTGHFDSVPGELRLKAYESRVMVSFLSLCLRRVWETCGDANRTTELELNTALTTRFSNWSLDLEQCPINLTSEQAERLRASGTESLVNHYSATTQHEQYPKPKEGSTSIRERN